MKPEEWGWHIVDGKCLPMKTDTPGAPAELLDIIILVVARNCATQRGAHVDNMACNAVMCVQNAEVQVVLVATGNCLMFQMIAWPEAIARC